MPASEAAPAPAPAAGSPPPPWANDPLFSGLPPLPFVPGAEPHLSVLDAFRLSIASQLSSILPFHSSGDSAEALVKCYEGVEIGRGTEKEREGQDRDLQVAVPRFKLKGDPKALAKKVEEAWVANEWVSGAKAQGVFVTFSLNTPTLCRLVLHQINALSHLTPVRPSTFSGYGVNSSGFDKEKGRKRKAIIEFSSPNIAKKFHAGHLRSTIIGAFLANLYEMNGWEVVRINYLGDWGRQFGILAVGFERYGSEEKLKSSPIQHLLDVYTSINRDMAPSSHDSAEVERASKAKETIEQLARDFFKKMEEGEEEAVKQWRRFRDYSIAQYEADYARLNVKFDFYSGESQVSHSSMDEALSVLREQKVTVEDNGTLVCDLEKWKLGKTVIRKKDGTNLYITRDIGEAKQRYDKYVFDKMIYVVASQQDLHLAQFFKVLDLMGYPWAKDLQHVSFGMVAGMSTRKGTSVHLEDMMDEAKNTMWEQMRKNEEKYRDIEEPEETADQVGIAGIKIQDMAAKRVNGYDFKWDRVLSFEGDTGAYLMYAHVRLCSIERKLAPEGLVLPPPSDLPSLSLTPLFTEPKARDLLFLLSQYPDAVKFAFAKLEASAIVTYCWRLTHAFSSAWEVMQVKGQEREVALARLWVFRSCRDVLASAMRLLTLKPLERM